MGVKISYWGLDYMEDIDYNFISIIWMEVYWLYSSLWIRLV